jgi:hypothetical protein
MLSDINGKEICTHLRGNAREYRGNAQEFLEQSISALNNKQVTTKNSSLIISLQ